VRLNIGGHFYETTNKTIARVQDTFLTSLISNRVPTIMDREGRYFIDRDGQFFAPILTYLRTEELSIPPTMSIDDVEREAKFYLIHPLTKIIKEIKEQEERENRVCASHLFENSSWKIYVDSYLNKYEKDISNFIKNRNKRGYLSAVIKVELIESDNDWAPSLQNSESLLILYLKSCTDMLIDCFGEYFQSNGFHVEYSYSERWLKLWWNKLRRRGRDKADIRREQEEQQKKIKPKTK